MTNEQLVDIYNPANASNLSAEQLASMQTLTREQIDVLAKAYPNKPRGNNYLLLFNTKLPLDKQVFQASTWENLSNLFKYNISNFIPYTFSSIMRKSAASTAKAATAQIQPAKIVDLSKQELAGADGLKQEQAPVLSQQTDGDNVSAAPLTESNHQQPTLNEEIQAKLNELNSELEALKAENAHHMTIKAKQKQIDDLIAESANQ